MEKPQSKTAKTPHPPTLPLQRWVAKFEAGIVVVLTLLLVLVITLITVSALYLFTNNAVTSLSGIHNISDLQQSALGAFSGILLILLGLELLDTIKAYHNEHRLRAELILLIGLIALGRHVLELDLHHLDSLLLFGLSGLILALAASYFLVKRAQISKTADAPSRDGNFPEGTTHG